MSHRANPMQEQQEHEGGNYSDESSSSSDVTPSPPPPSTSAPLLCTHCAYWPAPHSYLRRAGLFRRPR